jgi:hypothetical protein
MMDLNPRLINDFTSSCIFRALLPAWLIEFTVKARRHEESTCKTRWTRHWPKAIAVVTLISAGLAGAKHQDSRAFTGAPLVKDEAVVVHSAGRCMPCHDRAHEEFQNDGVYNFILPDCATTWKERDPHARAAEVIDPEKNPLAARMSKALGYNVKLKPECLACHTVDTAPTAPLEQKQFSWKYGVGCEACHGTATQWFEPHTLSTWRTKSSSEKEQLGLVDLRDPVKRAAKCATCHIGSSAEGKFVTHEMYAAGHPPLLPFEPATFGRDQPQHWALPESTKYFQSLSDDQAKKLFHMTRDEQFVPRVLATGALTTIRESARLLADEADKLPTGGILDFAHFDCFACHKELVPDSVRLQAGYNQMTPGRPPMRPVPTDLANAVLAHAHGAGGPDRRPELAERVGGLRSTFDQRPFGEPKAVSSAARHLQQWSDARIQELSSIKYDEAARKDLLRRILDTKPAAGAFDYDSAQLLAWAVRTLGWYDAPGPALKPLGETVLLSAGLAKTGAQGVLDDRLRKRYEFNPKKFQAAWNELQKSQR